MIRMNHDGNALKDTASPLAIGRGTVSGVATRQLIQGVAHAPGRALLARAGDASRAVSNAWRAEHRPAHTGQRIVRARTVHGAYGAEMRQLRKLVRRSARQDVPDCRLHPAAYIHPRRDLPPAEGRRTMIYPALSGIVTKAAEARMRLVSRGDLLALVESHRLAGPPAEVFAMLEPPGDVDDGSACRPPHGDAGHRAAPERCFRAERAGRGAAGLYRRGRHCRRPQGLPVPHVVGAAYGDGAIGTTYGPGGCLANDPASKLP